MRSYRGVFFALFTAAAAAAGTARLSALLRACRLFVADNYCRPPQSLQNTFRPLGKLPKLLEKLSIVSEFGFNDFIIRRAHHYSL